MGLGGGLVTAVTYEYGNTFLIVAGLLNFHYQGFLGNLIVAVAGAVLLLWIFGRAKASGVN